MIDFGWKVNVSDCYALQARIEAFQDNEVPDIVEEVVVEDIRNHAAAGIDGNERPFDPYSEEYKPIRRKYSRPTERVDLWLTPEGMLDGLHRDGKFITVKPKDERKAHGHMFHPPLKFRKFLLASVAAIGTLEKDIPLKLIRKI